MWSPIRQATAMIVRDGLAPPPVGNSDPSQIQRFGMSQVLPYSFVTLSPAVNPIRPPPIKCAVSFSVQRLRASAASSIWRMKFTACSTNLIGNAVRFSSRGGEIRLRMTMTEDWLEISIADDGAGIDPEFLPHLFEPFRQADPGYTRKTGGLGSRFRDRSSARRGARWCRRAGTRWVAAGAPAEQSLVLAMHQRR